MRKKPTDDFRKTYFILSARLLLNIRSFRLSLHFSHGYGLGTVTQNTFQMEEFASHGYIVFSLGHAHETLATIYPDGRIVPLQASRVKAVFGEETDSLYQKFVETKNVAEKDTLFRRLKKKYAIRDESLHIWTADTRFLIDADLRQPFMFMYSEELEGRDDPVYQRLTSPVYRITLKGSKHYNFSDFSIQSPLFKSAGFLGAIDGQRMLKIINAYTLAFFDKYLKHQENELLDGPSRDYPEVRFTRRNL